MRHVWVPDAGNVLLVGVLNLKMYALWGAPLTRANEYINFSKCMQAWGGLHLNPIDLFPGKPTETHGETWEYLGSPKIFCAEDSVSLRLWIFLETNTCKHMQTRSSTHRSHSEDMTLFSEMYALQGVPMTTLARPIPSIFQKWCAFRLPNPLKIHFSKKGIPQQKNKHSRGSWKNQTRKMY